MSATPNLQINHIAESQNNKEVTANEAFDVLDGANHGLLTIDLSAVSGDYSISDDNAKKYFVLRTTGGAGGAVNLILPATIGGETFRKFYAVQDLSTGGDVVVKPDGGTGVTFTNGDSQLIYTDGSTVTGIDVQVSAGGTPSAKTTVFKNGAGGTTDIAIGANVDPNQTDVWVDGQKLRKTIDFNVTESSPGSGNYDQITPLWDEAIPIGTQNVEIQYYT